MHTQYALATIIIVRRNASRKPVMSVHFSMGTIFRRSRLQVSQFRAELPSMPKARQKSGKATDVSVCCQVFSQVVKSARLYNFGYPLVSVVCRNLSLLTLAKANLLTCNWS